MFSGSNYCFNMVFGVFLIKNMFFNILKVKKHGKACFLLKNMLFKHILHVFLIRDHEFIHFFTPKHKQHTFTTFYNFLQFFHMFF